MPKLPRGMVRKKGRRGYYFRAATGGKETWIPLGSDYTQGRKRMRDLRERPERPTPEARLFGTPQPQPVVLRRSKRGLVDS